MEPAGVGQLSTPIPLLTGSTFHADPQPIPTGVGEPRPPNTRSPAPRAYPHGRGGTTTCWLAISAATGLSPRAWWNLGLPRRGTARRGPIPTGVGEPHSSRPPASRGGAYPHGRGGTSALMAATDGYWGLSPRAWGNRVSSRLARRMSRPIPTGVGEPRSCSRWTRPAGAYPHGRGGTLRRRKHHSPAWGLSPRAWGNPYGPMP